MAVKETYTVIGVDDIGAILEVATTRAKEMAALPALLAIAFEYSLLFLTDSAEERQVIRVCALGQAPERARQFRAIADKLVADSDRRGEGGANA